MPKHASQFRIIKAKGHNFYIIRVLFGTLICRLEMAAGLFGNIELIGGNALIPGYRDRVLVVIRLIAFLSPFLFFLSLPLAHTASFSLSIKLIKVVSPLLLG